MTKRPRRPYRGPTPPTKGWGYVGKDKYAKRGCLRTILILPVASAAVSLLIGNLSPGENHDRQPKTPEYHHILRNHRNPNQSLEGTAKPLQCKKQKTENNRK